MAGSLSNITDAMHAETLALSNAIQAADVMGVGRVVFESDCCNLKTAMSSSDYDLSPLSVLFSDMRYKLRTRFIDASVVFAPRGCNKPAHELAAMGVRVAPGEHVLWTMSYPCSVTRLVTGDMACLNKILVFHGYPGGLFYCAIYLFHEPVVLKYIQA